MKRDKDSFKDNSSYYYIGYEMMKDYIEGYHFKASNGNKYGTLILINKNKDRLTNMNKHGIKMNILLSQKIII